MACVRVGAISNIDVRARAECVQVCPILVIVRSHGVISRIDVEVVADSIGKCLCRGACACRAEF